MRDWLFKTPLRAGLFMVITGLIFTITTIAMGVSVGWNLGAVFGTRETPAWFLIPGGLVLGIGSALMGGFQLVTLILDRVAPRIDGPRIAEPTDEQVDND